MRAIFFLLALVPLCLHAASPYQDGKDFGASVKKKAMTASQALNESMLPEYFTLNPNESKITEGELSTKPNTIQSEVKDTAINSFNQRPRFKLNESDPIFRKPNYRAEGDKDCVEITEPCEQPHLRVKCRESLHLSKHQCHKDLIIKVEQPAVIDKIIDVSLGVYAKDDNVYTIDLKSGHVTVSGDKASRVRTDVGISEYLDQKNCPQMKISQHSMRLANVGNVPGRYSTRKVRIAVLDPPTCQNKLVGKFLLKKKGDGKWRKRGAIFQFRVIYQPPKKIKSEFWQDGCASLSEKTRLGACRLLNRGCSQGKATKNISGLKITRECWQETSEYECTLEQTASQCERHREKGCYQVGSACLKYSESGVCSLFEQTLHCPNKSCVKKTKTICGEKSLCSDGNCESQAYIPNQDLALATSKLAALKDAGNTFNQTNHQIFTGKNHQCRSTFANFKNCCKDKGWGLDTGLTDCKEDEKQLANLKESGVCHYVGEYCSKKVLGKCIVEKESYCCFGSKLGRVVQEQGRAQLGLGWGSRKHPQCSGLSPEDLQKIDFGEIDFSEVYSDLVNDLQAQSDSQMLDKAKQALQENFGQSRKRYKRVLQ